MAFPGLPQHNSPAAQEDAARIHEMGAFLRPQELDGRTTRGELRVHPNSPYFLKHHPVAWEVAKEGLPKATWLPILAPHVVQPGVNLCRTLREGEQPHEAYAESIKDAERQGFTFIDPSKYLDERFLPEGLPADIRPPTGYLVTYRCRDRTTTAHGTYWTEVWNIPDPVLPGQRQSFSYARAEYNRWRLHLVETKVIKPPHKRVLDPVRGRTATMVRRVQSQPLPDAIREVRIGEVKARQAEINGARLPCVGEGATFAPGAPVEAAPVKAKKARKTPSKAKTDKGADK